MRPFFIAAGLKGMAVGATARVPLPSECVPDGHDLQRTTGTGGNRSIEYLNEKAALLVPGRQSHDKVVIKGLTDSAISRTGDEEFFAKAGEAVEIFGPEWGPKMQRCHAVGPIFGDSTIARMGFRLKDTIASTGSASSGSCTCRVPT
jgi:hypothetical protein